MSPQVDVNRLKTVARPSRQAQQNLDLDLGFAGNESGPRGRAATRPDFAPRKQKGAASATPFKSLVFMADQAPSAFTRADRRDILRATVFL